MRSGLPLSPACPDETILPQRPVRLVFLDAFRGLAMLLMVSEGLGFAQAAERAPGSPGWQFLARQTTHARWEGCHLWDLIMPAFIFVVGVALPYSMAARRAGGQSRARVAAHVVIRSAVLVLLGILVTSNASTRTRFIFINVLCQIGLAYPLAALLVGRRRVVQGSACLLVLAAYWWWFYQYPLPAPGFDYASVGVPADWPHLTGLAAHWDCNTNPAAAFDRWFLNLFPRSEPFRFRSGGGTTLNFVPSAVTMGLGVMAGELIRGGASQGRTVRLLVSAGAAGLIAGVLLDPGILPGGGWSHLAVCPIVKPIWTPSWVLYSGGWVILALAALYALVDVMGIRRWTLPLVVVGMNSIAMYLMAALWAGWIRRTLRIHLGDRPFDWMGGPILEAAGVLAVLWLVCFWLYRRRILIRV